MTIKSYISSKLKSINPILYAKIWRTLYQHNILTDPILSKFLNEVLLDISDNDKILFVDCGANEGAIVKEVNNKLAGADIIAFEAQSELCAYMRKKLNYVEVRNEAVSDIDGEVDLFIPRNFGPNVREGTSIIKEKLKSEEIHEIRKCRCIDFSNFLESKRNIEKYNKIIVKMDVEGAEFAIIDKLIQKFELDKIKLVDFLLIEFHENIMGKNKYEYFSKLEKMEICTTEWI